MATAQAHHYPPVALGYYFGTRQRTHPLGAPIGWANQFFQDFLKQRDPQNICRNYKTTNSRSVKQKIAGPLSARTKSAVALKP
jgi:hypothetical protein